MTATPNGVQVFAVAPGGDRAEITEGVQALYDLLVQSMDFGSGFLSEEEIVPMLRVAEACGFNQAGTLRDYIAEQRRAEARHAERMREREQRS